MVLFSPQNLLYVNRNQSPTGVGLTIEQHITVSLSALLSFLQIKIKWNWTEFTLKANIPEQKI